MATSPPTRRIDRDVARIRAAQDLVSAGDVGELAEEVRRRSDYAVPPEIAPVSLTLPVSTPPPNDLQELFEGYFGIALPRTPRVASTSPEGTLGADAEPVTYYAYQHDAWRRLLALQHELVSDRCCGEYAAGRQKLDRFKDRIPTLPELDRWLEDETGWRVVRADGYVAPHKFFEFIANGRFPCMDQLRHEKELLYSPAPDMYHDIVGHLPMLYVPRFSEYYRLFGQVGMRARHPEQVKALDRIYWFTMEFGLLATETTPVAYGAALLTGLSELMTSNGVSIDREPFSIDAAIRTHTDLDRPNETLYVARDFDSLVAEFVAWAADERLL